MTVTAQMAVLPPGRQTLEIVTVALPPPGPWQVLIEQHASGVCHSQLDSIDSTSRAGQLLLGHEAMGEVTAVGANVTHVQPGDHVFVTWLPRSEARTRDPVPARVALPDGQWAHCNKIYTWATHTSIDEQYVVRASAPVSGDLGSVIGCAVMTGCGAVTNRAAVQRGQSIVVWGVGGVGLSAVAAARNRGASPVVAVDVQAAKLDLALKMGADHVVDASVKDPVSAVAALLAAAGRPEGAEFALECTGVPACLRQCIDVLRPGRPGIEPGGTALLVGVPQMPLQLDGMHLLLSEKQIAGVYGGGCVPERDFPMFVEWFVAGRLDLAALVTDRYLLSEVNDAVRDLRAGHVLGRAVLAF